MSVARVMVKGKEDRERRGKEGGRGRGKGRGEERRKTDKQINTELSE